MKLAPIADKIADRIKAKKPLPDWDGLRDECDQRTDGELDPVQLDMLTDMVQRRLEKAAA